MLQSLFALGLIALTSTANAAGESVFVVVGGYSTCPGSQKRLDGPLEAMTLWEPFERLVLEPASRAGRVQPYVLACFGVTKGNTRERRLFFRIRTADGVEQKTLLARDGNSLRPEDFEPAIRAIEQAIEDASRDRRVESLVAIGHSYGGWTLAEVSQRLGGRLPTTLFTVDPISPQQCSPYIYRSSGWRIPEGCQKAPAEWESTRGAQILAATEGRWWNFYQDQFALNHSGPTGALEASGQNLKIKVKTDHRAGIYAWHYHSLIARDPATWDWIVSRAVE